MKENSNNINEEILFEAMVKSPKSKGNILLKLNTKNVSLFKKKGLFKKQYKIIENIRIEDIKVIGDKVKIERKKTNVKISTNEKEYEFVFETPNEAKKILQLILDLKTGSTFLERTSKKVIKISNVAKKSVKAIGVTTAAVATTYKAIKDNKDTIINAAKTIKGLLGK